MVANEDPICGLEGRGPSTSQIPEQNMQRDGNHEGKGEGFEKWMQDSYHLNNIHSKRRRTEEVEEIILNNLGENFPKPKKDLSFQSKKAQNSWLD